MEEKAKLLDLIPKQREWVVKTENDQEIRTHGCSDEKNLELRLGPPGAESNCSAKNNPKFQRDESIISFSHFSSMTQRNGRTRDQDQKEMFHAPWPCSGYQQQQLKQQQPPKVPFIQYQTRPTAVAKESSQPCCTRMEGPQTAEKAFSPVAPAANAAMPNSSQKRAAPAPVVGWPPVRAFRKNLASSSSAKPSPEPQSRSPSKLGNVKPVENCRKGLFVKVNMDGIPIGRKVDLNAYDSYEKLSSAVDELFRGLLAAQRDSSVGENQKKDEEEKAITGLLDGSGKYTLVYEDNEGDRILVGDVPWHMFLCTVKRLRVLKSSDLPTLNRGVEKRGKEPIECASK